MKAGRQNNTHLYVCLLLIWIEHQESLITRSSTYSEMLILGENILQISGLHMFKSSYIIFFFHILLFLTEEEICPSPPLVYKMIL